MSGERKLSFASCWVIVEPPCSKLRAAEIRPRRARNPPQIDAGVPLEPLVLDGEHRLNEMGRDLIQRDLVAPLLEDRERRLVVAIEHDGGDRHVCQRADLPRARRAKDDVGDEGEKEEEDDAAGNLGDLPVARTQIPDKHLGAGEHSRTQLLPTLEERLLHLACYFTDRASRDRPDCEPAFEGEFVQCSSTYLLRLAKPSVLHPTPICQRPRRASRTTAGSSLWFSSAR